LGLLALMRLHDARRPARAGPEGEPVTLPKQDRSLWDQDLIDAGRTALERALAMGSAGPYQLQAAISALHVEAANADETDWDQIAELYGLLFQMNPSPVLQLNRAVAWSYIEGPHAALQVINSQELSAELSDYAPYHVARADLLERTGDLMAAAASYRRAASLTENEQERRYFSARARDAEAGVA
jgi:RNA polymerase sigma-70 factor (ECF subfamily)